MSVTKVQHPSVDERRAEGKESRERTSPSTHGRWVPGAERFDPIALLEQQNETREPDLVPVRHGRMMAPRSRSIAAPPRSWLPTSSTPPRPA